MRVSSLSFSTMLACMTVGLGSCGGESAGGPPEVRLGRDECLECGMIISEERSSCGMFIQRNGRRQHVLFDDIGCMLDVEREGRSDLIIVDRFVRDHGTKDWISAEAAKFLMAEPGVLPTPMGSGIAAFAALSDAEATQARVGGRLLDYTTLLVARREWMEQRYGKPRG